MYAQRSSKRSCNYIHGLSRNAGGYLVQLMEFGVAEPCTAYIIPPQFVEVNSVCGVHIYGPKETDSLHHQNVELGRYSQVVIGC